MVKKINQVVILSGTPITLLVQIIPLAVVVVLVIIIILNPIDSPQ